MLTQTVCNGTIKDERFRPNLIFFECLNRLICDYYRPQTKLRKGRGRYTPPGRHPPNGMHSCNFKSSITYVYSKIWMFHLSTFAFCTEHHILLLFRAIYEKQSATWRWVKRRLRSAATSGSFNSTRPTYRPKTKYVQHVLGTDCKEFG